MLTNSTEVTIFGNNPINSAQDVKDAFQICKNKFFDHNTSVHDIKVNAA